MTFITMKYSYTRAGLVVISLGIKLQLGLYRMLSESLIDVPRVFRMGLTELLPQGHISSLI